jgi:hypothetical protein
VKTVRCADLASDGRLLFFRQCTGGSDGQAGEVISGTSSAGSYEESLAFPRIAERFARIREPADRAASLIRESYCPVWLYGIHRNYDLAVPEFLLPAKAL